MSGESQMTTKTATPKRSAAAKTKAVVKNPLATKAKVPAVRKPRTKKPEQVVEAVAEIQEQPKPVERTYLSVLSMLMVEPEKAVFSVRTGSTISSYGFNVSISDVCDLGAATVVKAYVELPEADRSSLTIEQVAEAVKLRIIQMGELNASSDNAAVETP